MPQKIVDYNLYGIKYYRSILFITVYMSCDYRTHEDDICDVRRGA